MKYALFLGCTIPVRGQNYEVSARRVAKELNIEFEDIEEFSCCGFPVRSIDKEAQLLISARNLAIAEERGLDIITLCNACTITLQEAKMELDHNRELREKVNNKLKKIGKEYRGTVSVKHFARFLYEDYGIENIKEKIKKPLTNIRAAAHYGCHFIRPTEVYRDFDDPEHPKSLDELIEVTGAESPEYSDKQRCCGGGILGIKEEDALLMTKSKLDDIKEVGVDCMISICPFCSIMYEGNQKKIEKTYETEYKIPVLYYPQLLGLAMGIPSEELGFKLNRVKAKALLARIEKNEG